MSRETDYVDLAFSQWATPRRGVIATTGPRRVYLIRRTDNQEFVYAENSYVWRTPQKAAAVKNRMLHRLVRWPSYPYEINLCGNSLNLLITLRNTAAGTPIFEPAEELMIYVKSKFEIVRFMEDEVQEYL